MVRIGVLTSSRADFGVYLPLLRAFLKDKDLQFDIIAFGTHLSNLHGYTITDIEQNGFKVKYKIASILSDDTEIAIATSASLTSLKFADFWENNRNNFDVVLCLGDRYEMFSAVIAGVPFGVRFAHFYGGDYTLGAIDNVYRDGMTHASIAHFTSTQKCADRVLKMLNYKAPVEVIGILSLEEIKNVKLLSIDEFKTKWHINLAEPTIIITVHPETILPENNIQNAIVIDETIRVLKNKYQLIITMPNADTNGLIYRKVFEDLILNSSENVFLIENFGLQSYFSCMNYASIMLGNTSSGISESASFGKYFINIGSRQKGREVGDNIINVPFNTEHILKTFDEIYKLGSYKGQNIYKRERAIDKIILTLKSL